MSGPRMKFNTGKVMLADFALSAQHRRQAVEFLRSRGLDEPASCQGPVEALALVLREGGGLGLDQLKTMTTFTLRTWTHAFNKLFAIGALAKTDGRARLHEALPVQSAYYLEAGARFVRVSDLPVGRDRKKVQIPKFQAEALEHGQLGFTILQAQPEGGIPESFTLVPASAYLHVAKLKGLQP